MDWSPGQSRVQHRETTPFRGGDEHALPVQAGRFPFLTGVAAATILLAAVGCEESRAPAMTGAVGTDVNGASPAEGAASDTATAASADNGPGKGDPPAEASSPAGDATASASVPPERTRDISFDDLAFDMKKGDPFERSLLTEKIEAMAGKPIRIRGYILPSFQQSGLSQFVLVRDNQSCCFGPGAALYDCIIVEMKPGKSTDYSSFPVAVDGTFSIRELLDPDGKTVAIFHLDGENVR